MTGAYGFIYIHLRTIVIYNHVNIIGSEYNWTGERTEQIRSPRSYRVNRYYEKEKMSFNNHFNFSLKNSLRS